jgi:hypothetical protein
MLLVLGVILLVVGIALYVSGNTQAGLIVGGLGVILLLISLLTGEDEGDAELGLIAPFWVAVDWLLDRIMPGRVPDGNWG